MAYTASVGHGVTEATVSDADASVEITPEDADDETPGNQVNLAVGETWPWGRGSCNRTTCDAPLTRERAKSPRLCIRQHPAALGETVRFRPLGTMPPAHRGQGVGETAQSPGAAPCPTPTVVVAGSGAGVSGCCGGGASSLGETTVYSPSSKSPLRPYARCPMQRAMFLTFVARGWSTPQSTLREDGHSGRLAAANGLWYRWPPQTPAVAGLRRQTAGLRPPGAPQR